MIILMGIAGAGKGTQAQMLVDRDGYSVVATGDTFRRFATEEQRNRMLHGYLLKDEDIFEMLSKAFAAVPDLRKCILDGAPRSIPQADWLLEQIKQDRLEIKAVVHIAVSEDVVRHRLMGRGRSDDTDAGIAKRFEEYRNNTLPILNYLKNHSVKVCEVDGDQEPDAVHQDILGCIE